MLLACPRVGTRNARCLDSSPLQRPPLPLLHLAHARSTRRSGASASSPSCSGSTPPSARSRGAPARAIDDHDLLEFLRPRHLCASSREDIAAIFTRQLDRAGPRPDAHDVDATAGASPSDAHRPPRPRRAAGSPLHRRSTDRRGRRGAPSSARRRGRAFARSVARIRSILRLRARQHGMSISTTAPTSTSCSSTDRSTSRGAPVRAWRSAPSPRTSAFA